MNNDTVTQAFVAKEIFGIDPGSNGGVVKYNGERFESRPLKKMETFEDMVDFFKYQKEICKMPLVFLEKITSFQSDYSDKDGGNAHIGKAFKMDKLKVHYTELISALKMAELPFIPVMATSWQRYIKIHKSGEEYKVRKNRYKDIAKDWHSAQKIVGWNADAYLLIDFARKKLKYEPSWIFKEMKKNKPKERRLFNGQ